MVLARWCAALAARGSRFRLGSGEEVYAAAGLGEDGVRRRQHGRGKRETRGDTQAAHGERAREGEEGPGAVVCVMDVDARSAAQRAFAGREPT